MVSSRDVDQRRCYYRELFKFALNECDIHGIRLAAHYCQPLRSGRFRAQIAEKTEQKLGQLHRGRPRMGLVKK